MKDGKTELYGRAENYLLVADATGIPVLAAILEDLPSAARGTCIIEVHSKEDEQYLHTLADIDFIWLHNPQPQQGSSLAAVVKQQQLPEISTRLCSCRIFFSKGNPKLSQKRKQWKQEELYAYSYWKSGVAEDQSAGERRKENAESVAESK